MKLRKAETIRGLDILAADESLLLLFDNFVAAQRLVGNL